MDMDLKDYDFRTALHVAAAEGKRRKFRLILHLFGHFFIYLFIFKLMTSKQVQLA